MELIKNKKISYESGVREVYDNVYTYEWKGDR